MKIGILGGTFDPIHRGHTFIALEVRRILDLSGVLFMVAPTPPHKRRREISSAHHRFAMVGLELQGQDDLFPCAWELENRQTAYTIDTLDHLAREHPGDQFCFIAGSDALKDLDSWKDCARLIEEHCFVFVQRPGTEVEMPSLKLAEAHKQRIHTLGTGTSPSLQAGQSFLITLDAPPVSSTDLRERFRRGEVPGAEILSPAVTHYIQRHRLYEHHSRESETRL